MSYFSGVPVVISGRATRRVWNWPEGKRSKRLRKKLTKLRGPQCTTEPAAYQMADGRMLIHPELYRKMKEKANE